jgi:hypothetical protein
MLKLRSTAGGRKRIKLIFVKIGKIVMNGLR